MPLLRVGDSRGGGGLETEGGSQLFETAVKGPRGHEKWAVKRGRVMQICVCDHVEVHPQTKKNSLFCKKTWERWESRVISCQNQNRTLNAVI